MKYVHTDDRYFVYPAVEMKCIALVVVLVWARIQYLRAQQAAGKNSCWSDVQISADATDINRRRHSNIPLMSSTYRLFVMPVLCIGFFLVPLHSFSWSVLVGFAASIRCDHRPSPSCLFANEHLNGHIFQDDECEDLCGAYGDDTTNLVSTEDAATNAAPVPSDTPSSIIGRRAPRREYRSYPRRTSVWSDPQPSKCETCHGEGEQTCRFCGGTDFLSAIGGETDALFIEGIGRDCPVCNDGVEVCHKCSGTGYVFSWKPARNVTSSLHP